MSGHLTLQNSSSRAIFMNVVGDSTTVQGRLVASATGTSIYNYPDKSDTTNYRYFMLRNTSNSYPDVSSALYLYDYIDGTGTTYDVFTEANLKFSLSGTTLTITKSC